MVTVIVAPAVLSTDKEVGATLMLDTVTEMTPEV